ncbi:hypothetical protein EPUS_08766 [Endocarpon pusillum Z07020]|uniref:Integrase catalytic domain-containing protein n=1 Tax=Endocarpon pusillum (strain Z07020 / HMAS-L-300199) TaxID=1263415 RepID=U1HIC6_ENDPU|nr:uncharacterized protein EPUS_08766 [Endocarpon pusillum Z07020]ERF69955.1 hypothetical protein EPUS_08766 [Endocarpon pusillum Z07020]
MDFITKLPPSQDQTTKVKYDSILVITDRLTKYAYFIPYLESSTDRLTKYAYFIPYLESSTAEDMAHTFLQYVYANHGMPSEIISDRDKLFTSKFWKSLMDQIGTKHKLSTAYHPQTDGQTERINQTLEQYLRCYVNYRQNNWVTLLPLAQFAYNSSTAATGMSPFYANYGYEPVGTRPARNVHEIAQKASMTVEMMKELHQELSRDIEFIATRSAIYHNSKRMGGPTFKEGDAVYLLRKNIKTKRPSSKLDYTKLGPYPIKKVLGKANTKEHARPTEIQLDDETQDQEYEVEKVLDKQDIDGKPYYLIKWSGYTDSENTWEPETNLSPETLANYRRRNPDQAKKTSEQPTPARRGCRPRQHWIATLERALPAPRNEPPERSSRCADPNSPLQQWSATPPQWRENEQPPDESALTLTSGTHPPNSFRHKEHPSLYSANTQDSQPLERPGIDAHEEPEEPVAAFASRIQASETHPLNSSCHMEHPSLYSANTFNKVS